MNKTDNKLTDKSSVNGQIELLRFLFCMAVLFFHAEKYFLGEPSSLGGFKPYFFVHGAVGVEFFFVCSGFFMARSIKRSIARSGTADTGDSTVTKDEDIRNFNNLDVVGTEGSKKQFIILNFV